MIWFDRLHFVLWPVSSGLRHLSILKINLSIKNHQTNNSSLKGYFSKQLELKVLDQLTFFANDVFSAAVFALNSLNTVSWSRRELDADFPLNFLRNDEPLDHDSLP